MFVKLLNEYHLEFLSLKGGCTGSKMPHYRKSHVMAHFHFPNLASYKLIFPNYQLQILRNRIIPDLPLISGRILLIQKFS